MKRYIALLRGVNISGKNKVPMANLKKCFEALGVMEVKTCLNSGNVIFSGEETDTIQLTIQIEAMIKERFLYAFHSVDRVCIILFTCNHTDTLMSLGKQIRGHRITTIVIIQHN